MCVVSGGVCICSGAVCPGDLFPVVVPVAYPRKLISLCRNMSYCPQPVWCGITECTRVCVRACAVCFSDVLTIDAASVKGGPALDFKYLVALF